MQQFTYITHRSLDFHTRSAKELVKDTSSYDSFIILQAGDQKVDGKRRWSFRNLNVRPGQTITVTINGADEQQAKQTLQQRLPNYL